MIVGAVDGVGLGVGVAVGEGVTVTVGSEVVVGAGVGVGVMVGFGVILGVGVGVRGRQGGAPMGDVSRAAEIYPGYSFSRPESAGLTEDSDIGGGRPGIVSRDRAYQRPPRSIPSTPLSPPIDHYEAGRDRYLLCRFRHNRPGRASRRNSRNMPGSRPVSPRDRKRGGRWAMSLPDLAR